MILHKASHFGVEVGGSGTLVATKAAPSEVKLHGEPFSFLPLCVGFCLLGLQTRQPLVGVPGLPDGVRLLAAVRGPHHVVVGAAGNAVAVAFAEFAALASKVHDLNDHGGLQVDVVLEEGVLGGCVSDLTLSNLEELLDNFLVVVVGLSPVIALVLVEHVVDFGCADVCHSDL